jgi:DNA-binding transcriptional ArsR family regulator
MTLDSAYLHKILKDETRRKIVLLLHDRSNLAYSDLLEALKTQDRGRLNYHLKDLTTLLNKSTSGYSLNEQGMLAWKMLQEFAYSQKSRLATLIKFGRNGVALGLLAIFFLSYHQYLSDLWLFGAVAILSTVTLGLVVLVKVQYGKLSSCHSINCVDASLHETLTDETRRKIINLLRENESLSYSALMTEVGVDSNGQMNYHLKMLGDMLSVDEKGHYSLTEKGVFAYTSQYSLQSSRNLLKMNSLWQQWLGIAFVSVLFLLGIFFLYSRESLSLETALLNLISVVLVSSVLFYFSKVNDNLKLYKVKNTQML